MPVDIPLANLVYLRGQQSGGKDGDNSGRDDGTDFLLGPREETSVSAQYSGSGGDGCAEAASYPLDISRLGDVDTWSMEGVETDIGLGSGGWRELYPGVLG